MLETDAPHPGVSSGGVEVRRRCIAPLDFAVKELVRDFGLQQCRELKGCGCPRNCWQAIVEDKEAVSLWRSFSEDFGQLKEEKVEAAVEPVATRRSKRRKSE